MGAEDHRSRLVPAPTRVAGGERATLRTHGRGPAAKPFAVCLRILDARAVEPLGAAATGRGGQAVSQEAVSHGA